MREPSRWSALYPDEEELPPLPETAVSEVTPEQLAALESDVPTTVRVPPAPEVPEAPPARSAEDIVRERLTKPKFSTLGEAYDIPMSAATPAPRTENANRLAAGLSRAGTTIGSALAGVKPNYEFSNQLRQDGAIAAAGQDKANDDLVNFKQQLLARVIQDREAGRKAAGKADLDFAQADALFSKDPNLSKLWTDYKTEAQARGTTPDVDLFAKQAASMRGQSGATTRLGTTQENINRRQESEQHFRSDLNERQNTQHLDFAGYTDSLKVAKDQRDATHPNRAMLNPSAPPTLAQAEGMRVADADSQFIVSEIERLRNLVRSTPGDIMRVMPGFRGQVKSLQQAIASATLHANHYGVPNGSDWNMVYNEIGDPTRFVDLVTNSQDDQILEAAHSAIAKADAKAAEYGYGPYKAGSGASQRLPAPVRPDVARGTGTAPGAGSPPPAGPDVVPPKVTPAGNPYKIAAKDKVTHVVHYFDANGDEVQ